MVAGELLLIDPVRSAHINVPKAAPLQPSSPHLLDIVSIAELADDAGAPDARQDQDQDLDDHVSSNLDKKQTARLKSAFRLGGMLLLRCDEGGGGGGEEEAADIAFRYMTGLLVTQVGDEGSMYLPPFLRYGYCPEAPVLFEGASRRSRLSPLASPPSFPSLLAIAHPPQIGRRQAAILQWMADNCQLPGSILKNLLLGAQHSTYCVLPTSEEAWRVAEMCGLEAEFLRAPDGFNVGKGGRNLPISARQCICLARCILSDPSVLLLHKPISLLSVEKASRVLSTLKMFVEYGGLHGLLSRQKRFHSEAPTAYVLGNGTRQASALMK